MKIDTLTIDNFKAIEHLQLDLNGKGAAIYGQNGTGKTTILDAVTWLFSNKMSDGKCGESSNFHAPDKVTTVALTFTNGLKLRRECNGHSVFFINSVPCNASDFKYQIAQIFKGAVPVLLTPFNFCNLQFKDRRGILLKVFAPKFEIDLEPFSEIASELEETPPEQIIKSAAYIRKQYDKESDSIPARIDELQKSLVEVDVDAAKKEIAALTKQVAAKLEEIKALQESAAEKAALENEIAKVEMQILKLENNVNAMRLQYSANESDLKKLRQTYSDTCQLTTGTCPTCGAKVPAADLADVESKLAETAARGKELAEKQELIKQGAEVAKTKIAELRKQADGLKSKRAAVDTNALQAAISARDALQEKLNRAKMTLAEASRAAEIQRRIEELKAREIELGALKNRCDKRIYQAEMYIRRKIELLEKSINDHFQFVKFKMFEDFKTIDGVKEICEPLLNGVPYAALSKGEQLKASLDILQALQSAYKIELPVIIDDAESYTSNSFVNLPNQVILLKAAEGVTALQIDAEKSVERKSA